MFGCHELQIVAGTEKLKDDLVVDVNELSGLMYQMQALASAGTL
jgi:hypothetical protein